MQKILQFTKRTMILGCCLIFILTSSGSGFAETIYDSEEEHSSETKAKVASAALTLLYLPVKAAYAGLGGIVGGIAYIFSGGNEETAQVVWTPTIKGTYVITPAHLRGDKPVQFFGQEKSETSHYKLGRGARLKKSPAP